METSGPGRLTEALSGGDRRRRIESLLESRGVPIRRDLSEMIEKDGRRIQMVGIPTSIDSHRDLMIQAVEAGFDVVLEKPSAPTIQDIDDMLEALKRTGRFCQIGYQSQSNSTVQALKREICSGRLGAIRDVVGVGLWRRDEDYYARNPWAGRLLVNGRYVLDETINNPLAHYLFNALFFASTEWAHAAIPTAARAELYHGHRIESEDTSCLEMSCDNGAQIHFYATLCASRQQATVVETVGDKGRAVWSPSGPVKFFKGKIPDGELPDTAANAIAEQFRNAVRHHRGIDKELNCPLAMTHAHVLAVNGAFESAGRPKAIPQGSLRTVQDEDEGMFTEIPGIEELVARCVAERKLFSDVGAEWAVKSRRFSLENYKRFELR